ncbi:MAG: hypothetical protein ACI4C4_01470 [Lachnospiraceae bacterium]
MRNIRIWAEDQKKCEAIWLGYFLTLCGCQVWKGRIGNIDSFQEQTEMVQYLNVLIFDDIDIDSCYHMAEKVFGQELFISGDIDEERQEPLCAQLRFVPRIDFEDTDSLSPMVEALMGYIADDEKEYKSALKLLNCFVLHENSLTKAIYIVDELFCSRRIDYTSYDYYGVLIDEIYEIEKWRIFYERQLTDKTTFVEKFSITFLQNLLNEGIIKARKEGGFNTDRLLANANYLWKIKPETKAALFLQLQIMHNSILVSDRFQDVADTLEKITEKEYKNRVYCELGDIYREYNTSESKQGAESFFKKIDNSDLEFFRGWYKLGLLYEERGGENQDFMQMAMEQYDKIIEYISEIDVSHRTPQEFEYYYKAKYKMLELQVEEAVISEGHEQEELLSYEEEAKKIYRDCIRIQPNIFLDKLFGEDGEMREKINGLMNEKMGYIQRGLKNIKM